MRRIAVQALVASLAAAPAAATDASCVEGDGPWIARVCFAAPLDPPRYRHGILGDTPEWGALHITPGPLGQRLPQVRDSVSPDGTLRLDALSGRIIEDIAPRVSEVAGGGPPEVVFVESDHRRGSRISVLDLERLAVIPGPFIGQRHRWLAPLGVADLDGDGRPELVWVDRPHLARVLRIGRYNPEVGTITEIASADGHTNHRIGDRSILGGIRDCNAMPEIVTATPDWSRLLASRLEAGRLVTRDIGPNRPAALRAALACR